MNEEPAGQSRALYVWDPAVRLFHWVLLVLVTTSVVTGLSGGNAMVWHERSGIAILVLLLFRWLWGLFGSSTARFGEFLAGPRKVLAFLRALLRQEPVVVVGHNPLGGWMVLLLLLCLTLQVSTGLFADDEILTSGPLAHLVDNATNALLTSVHGANAWVVIGLILIHVAAVLFHLAVRGEDLVRPMLTGRRSWPEDRPRPTLSFVPGWAAVGLFLLCMATTFTLLTYFGH